MSTEFIDVANTENIQQELWLQCENEEFCDVALIAGTKEKIIPAHSNILSAASKYFKEIFQTLKCENQVKEIKLSCVDGDILQSLVKYCYTGRLTINKDNAVELLKTAHEVLLHNVVTACANFLVEQLQPSNCLEFAKVAKEYYCETFLQKARDYSLEHFMAVRETDEFLRLKPEQLSELLACDNLTVSSEENVFNSLFAWIRHDPIEREKYQAELLKLVRLPLLETTFLREHVKPICTSTECREFYLSVVEELMLLYDGKSNGRRSVKPRRPNQLLMGITINGFKMHIHYHCPQRLKWMMWSKDLEARGWPGLAVMEDNLFLFGGSLSGCTASNTAICLNFKTLDLREISPMTEHRRFCRAAVLNGVIYAVGGRNKDILNSVEKWNPKTNTWKNVASMEVSRSAFGIAVLNEKLYVVGGYTSGSATNLAECYNPHENVWMSIASMHEARYHFGIAVCNGLLYAVGGSGDMKTVERYNPETNTWTMLSNINDNLNPVESCTAFRDKVIVCYKDHVEEYDEETNEWKTSATLNVLENNYHMFTYSNELLTSEFFEN